MEIEKILDNINLPEFKSDGEKKIAYFLEDNVIKYRYVKPASDESDYGNKRITPPQFFLPEFKNYIEYFGRDRNQNYDQLIHQKEKMYRKMEIEVISIYKWMFQENWQGHIMQELKRITVQRYRKLMSKRYWSNGGNHHLKNHEWL